MDTMSIQLKDFELFMVNGKVSAAPTRRYFAQKAKAMILLKFSVSI